MKRHIFPLHLVHRTASRLAFFPVLFAFLTLACCTKEIEFNGEVTEPQMLLYVNATPGEEVVASVSTSMFFLTPYDIRDYTDLLDTIGGHVYLYMGGRTSRMSLDTLQHDSRVLEYSCDCCPVEGDSLTVSSSFPLFGTVSGGTRVPGKASFSIVSYETVNEDDYSVDVKVTIRLEDDGSYHKYYSLSPEVYFVEDGQSCYYGTYDFSSNDVIFNETTAVGTIASINSPTAGPYFSDMLIRGTTHEVTFTVLSVPKAEYLEVEKVELYIILKTLTESYYHYASSYGTASSLMGAIMQIFSEPALLYSNVTGGIGCVCASASAEEKVF